MPFDGPPPNAQERTKEGRKKVKPSDVIISGQMAEREQEKGQFMIQEPLCGHRCKSTVIDSRPSGRFKNAIRRRRECRTCGRRFSTIEFLLGDNGKIEHHSVVSADQIENLESALRMASQRITQARKALNGEDRE